MPSAQYAPCSKDTVSACVQELLKSEFGGILVCHLPAMTWDLSVRREQVIEFAEGAQEHLLYQSSASCGC